MDSKPWIEALKKNNDVPSDVAFEEVKDMLRKPLKDLHDLDAEIQSLEQRLAELKTRRTEAQQLLTPYQSILSPIRRLPTDILGEIFSHCFPTHRNPIIKTTDCPMLLTQICSRWRAVAIADPRLWSRLYITFSDDDLIPVGDADGIDTQSETIRLLDRSKQRAVHMLRTRIDAVKEWLSRSGSRPLSITLKFTCNLSRANLHSIHDPATDMTLEFFEFLGSISSRFEDLELIMSIDMYRFLENMMAIPEMKKLNSFRVDYQTASLFSRQESWRIPVGLLEAPNLRKILMSGDSLAIWGVRRSSQDWSRLTHIACYHQISVSELTYFLQNSPNLVFFQANIGREFSDSGLSPDFSQREISLPFLRSLHITERINPSIIGDLWEAIDAPSLYWVTHVIRFPPHDPTEGLLPISIIPLLRKSTTLRKLTVDAYDISAWGIDRLLRVVPTITHLAFGTKPRPYSSSLPRIESAGMFYRSRNSSWDIGGLLVDHRSTNPPLLPNLESLDVSIQNGYFSDEALKDFVINRLNPSSPRRIQPLKHLGITFYREREMDVEREIRRHAELAGVEIDLELDYPDALHNPQPRTFSPAYGLHSQDDLSWSPSREYDGIELAYPW